MTIALQNTVILTTCMAVEAESAADYKNVYNEASYSVHVRGLHNLQNLEDARQAGRTAPLAWSKTASVIPCDG